MIRMQPAIQSPIALLSTLPEMGWDSLEQFAQWYMQNGMPMAVPWDAEVIVSDDATAICVFRKPPYQVELYLIHPSIMIPEHAHPGLETLVVHLGGGFRGNRMQNGLSDLWGTSAGKTSADETHGGSQLGVSPKGYAMLTFEKWPDGVPMTSAAAHWRGDTAGPKQDVLIRRHYPTAIAIPGFADVARGRPEPIL